MAPRRRTSTTTQFTKARETTVPANKKTQEENNEQMQTDKKEAEPVIQEKEDETIVETKPVEISKEESVREEKNTSSETDKKTAPLSDKFDKLFPDKAKEHGVQQSVYFKKDIYDYCKELSVRYETKFSDIVNKLLENAIYGDMK